MTRNFLLTDPRDFTREGYAEALRRAEALPDDDPDKAEMIAARKWDLEVYYDHRHTTPQERRAILRSLLIDPPA